MIERQALLFVLLTYSADKLGAHPWWDRVDGIILALLAAAVAWKILSGWWRGQKRTAEAY